MSEEIAAGYLLVRRIPRPAYSSQSLLPSYIVSASECICPRFPDTSAIAWVGASEEARSDDLRAVGVPSERQIEARSWATDQFQSAFGWPGVFYTAASALQAREHFFTPATDVMVVGLGLQLPWVEEFISFATPPPPADGFGPQGESGYLETAKRHEVLSPGYQRLGFEPLSIEAGQIGCSWLCNGLETHCADVLGIQPGKTGLLETSESAERCCAEISREEVGAEPGPWLPWLLVVYA